MENISVHEGWEIKYRGAEQPKLFDWYAWELAQKFVNDVEVTSIVFYAEGMSEPASGRPHTTGRLYEETLSKDDLAGVSREWIEERRKRIEQQSFEHN